MLFLRLSKTPTTTSICWGGAYFDSVLLPPNSLNIQNLNLEFSKKAIDPELPFDLILSGLSLNWGLVTFIWMPKQIFSSLWSSFELHHSKLQQPGLSSFREKLSDEANPARLENWACWSLITRPTEAPITLHDWKKTLVNICGGFVLVKWRRPQQVWKGCRLSRQKEMMTFVRA